MDRFCHQLCFYQVNDFVRDKFYDKNGNIPIYGEIISGACVSINHYLAHKTYKT